MEGSDEEKELISKRGGDDYDGEQSAEVEQEEEEKYYEG